jgi:hypothetical protein
MSNFDKNESVFDISDFLGNHRYSRMFNENDGDRKDQRLQVNLHYEKYALEACKALMKNNEKITESRVKSLIKSKIIEVINSSKYRNNYEAISSPKDISWDKMKFEESKIKPIMRQIKKIVKHCDLFNIHDINEMMLLSSSYLDQEYGDEYGEVVSPLKSVKFNLSDGNHNHSVHTPINAALTKKIKSCKPEKTKKVAPCKNGKVKNVNNRCVKRNSKTLKNGACKNGKVKNANNRCVKPNSKTLKNKNMKGGFISPSEVNRIVDRLMELYYRIDTDENIRIVYGVLEDIDAFVHEQPDHSLTLTPEMKQEILEVSCMNIFEDDDCKRNDIEDVIKAFNNENEDTNITADNIEMIMTLFRDRTPDVDYGY